MQRKNIPTTYEVVRELRERFVPLAFVAERLLNGGPDDEAVEPLIVGVHYFAADLQCLFDDVQTWQTAEHLAGGAA